MVFLPNKPYIGGISVESAIRQHHSPQLTVRLWTSGAVNTQHSENTNGCSVAQRNNIVSIGRTMTH